MWAIARGLFCLRDGDFQAASIELKRSAEEVQTLPEGWVPLRTQIYTALAMALRQSRNAEEALSWWGKARESERGLVATVRLLVLRNRTHLAGRHGLP